MKCEKCTKKATVHLTEIVDGKSAELHLCEDCAREQSQSMEQQFGLADLLAGLTDFGKQIPETKKNILNCSVCGLSYEDFRKFGRFGCAHCYTMFRVQLQVLLKKIHGSNVHLGKTPFLAEKSGLMDVVQPEEDSVPPVKSSQASDLESLRARLQQAIINENFEQAVLLRDQIRQIDESDKL